MNKLIATFAAASMLVAAQAPAFASDYGRPVKPFVSPKQISLKHHNGNGAKVVAGIALGAFIVGSIIASRAKAEQSYHRADTCSIWLKDCRYGSDRACYKYDSRC